MLEQPLVSIIIPTYNRAHLIGETLDSVLAQTYQNWECIVVDDGSTDGTEQMIKEYIALDPRFQFHKRPETHLPGGNGARNYGFNLSKGEYIQWFDSDDVMKPNKLKLSVAEIQKKKTDLVVSDCNFLGKGKRKRELEFDNLLKYHIADGTINTPMCFFRKEILKGFAFDETLARSQEFEFFTRLFGSKEINFSILQDSLSEIRSHTASITGKFEKGDERSIASMLFAKWSAVQYSTNLDLPTQDLVNQHFEKALWKSLIFRHKSLYWTYLDLYHQEKNTLGRSRKLKLSMMASFYFLFNRGGKIIKKHFFH